MTSLARWVSIVAHPFVTTLVLVAATESRGGAGAAARAVAAVAVLVVLPLAVLTVVQVRRGAWGTVDASHPSERPVLFRVGGCGVLALLGYLAWTQPGSALMTGGAGVLAMVVVCAAITPWIKVSLHVATLALAAAVLVAEGITPGWPLAAVLPVLAWSRIALGRHRWIEVALGFVVGAATGAAVAHLG